MFKTMKINVLKYCAKSVRSFSRSAISRREISKAGIAVSKMGTEKPVSSKEFLVSKKLSEAKLNWERLCDPRNRSKIIENVAKRRMKLDVDSIFSSVDKLLADQSTTNGDDFKKLMNELVKLPNETHPNVERLTLPRLVCERGEKPVLGRKPRDMETLSQHNRLLRYKHVGKICHRHAYYLQGDLALLEQALINYTMDKLKEYNFMVVSVPDVIHSDIVKACGVTGDSSVYHLSHDSNGPEVLSGTSEMALAGMFAHRTLKKVVLPQRYVAVSRCYRHEISRGTKEYGLFRVKEFYKVEMFILAPPNVDTSEELLQELVTTQQMLFSELGLCYKVLEMPLSDLAAAAYHKYDIEAWMPGRNRYGEISSASNCTDYQSRRLHIRCTDSAKGLEYVHTLNGTACAVPRMLIAIFEQNQQVDSSIKIPNVLWPYMHGIKEIKEKKWVQVERTSSPPLPRGRRFDQKDE